MRHHKGPAGLSDIIRYIRFRFVASVLGAIPRRLAPALLLTVVAACQREPEGRPEPAPAPAAAPAPAPKLPPVTCRPELDVAVSPRPGQSVNCVIDVGSRNLKLIVAGLHGDDPSTLETLRQCRTRLQLGDRSFDPATGRGRDLPRAEQDMMVEIITAYQARCAQDGGKLAGALATEWARRATNAAAVVEAVAGRSGVPLAVLSRDEEAHYGYLSAARGVRGRLVLDFGSRSLQLSFWPRDAAHPEVVSVPLGIDEAGDRFFGAGEAERYADGRKALAATLRATLRTTLSRARTALRKGKLDPELISLGENGDLALAVSGALWPGKPPSAVDEGGYAAAVKGAGPRVDPARGLVTAVLTAPQVMGVVGLLERQQELFQHLRSEKLRRVYGNKMLVFPALVALLEAELGLKTMVLVPQEMAEGFLVARAIEQAFPSGRAGSRSGN